MRHIIRATLFTAAAVPSLVLARPIHAQSFAGSWEASVATRVSTDGNTETPSGFAPVALNIDQKGDSLFATYKRAAIEGAPAGAELKFKGVLKNGEVRLVAEPIEGRINRGGEESIVKTLMILTLKAQNDELVGTITMAPQDESIPPMTREFRAARKKGGPA